MSRQNPCTKTTVSSASPDGSTTSTCRSTPSTFTVRCSSAGSSPNGSWAYGSGTLRVRPTTYRSSATPAATPAAARPTTAPAHPARLANLPLRSGSVTLPPGSRLRGSQAHCSRSRRLPLVRPRHPRPDPGHDLVADGVEYVRPVVRRRLAVVARPEDGGDVAGVHERDHGDIGVAGRGVGMPV